jgi:hypothetical protein
MLQEPVQHEGPPSLLHPSPVARHWAAGGVPHRPPRQSAEQHWLSTMQGCPEVSQSAPPHVPPLHPSEQHSLGSSHRAPSARQYCAHASAPVRPIGSQRPLQQVLRVLHATPGAEHVPDGKQ